MYGDKFNGSTASEHNMTVEGVTIDGMLTPKLRSSCAYTGCVVEDGRETIGILEEDVTLEFCESPLRLLCVPCVF